MFAAVSLDDDVAGDVVSEDHNTNEGHREVVEVASEQAEDCSSEENVEDVETHPHNQLAVRRAD